MKRFVLLSALVLTAVALCAPVPASAVGPNAVAHVSGCDANTLAANDDESTGAVALPFELNFFGAHYNSAYVNNNGNVTFTEPLDTFTPEPILTLGLPLIAPFWADVDTTGLGSDVVTYGNATFQGRPAFCVMWDGVGVGYYDAQTDKLNNFQLLLVDRSDVAAGDFDIVFNYDQIQWETGDASDGVGGLGGFSARWGFTDGSATSFEGPGSAVNGALLDSSAGGLTHNSRNSLQLGRYVFPVRNGAPPAGGEISGTVTDSASNPVLGALVQVHGDRPRRRLLCDQGVSARGLESEPKPDQPGGRARRNDHGGGHNPQWPRAAAGRNGHLTVTPRRSRRPDRVLE
jgi:hypothetical protein